MHGQQNVKRVSIISSHRNLCRHASQLISSARISAQNYALYFFPVVSYTLTICCTRVQIQIIFYTVSYASCTIYGANHS